MDKIMAQTMPSAYRVEYIAFEDRPDTASRVAKECMDRPDFMMFNLPDMPRTGRQLRQRFLSSRKRR